MATIKHRSFGYGWKQTEMWILLVKLSLVLGIRRGLYKFIKRYLAGLFYILIAYGILFS